MHLLSWEEVDLYLLPFTSMLFAELLFWPPKIKQQVLIVKGNPSIHRTVGVVALFNFVRMNAQSVYFFSRLFLAMWVGARVRPWDQRNVPSPCMFPDFTAQSSVVNLDQSGFNTDARTHWIELHIFQGAAFIYPPPPFLISWLLLDNIQMEKQSQQCCLPAGCHGLEELSVSSLCLHLWCRSLTTSLPFSLSFFFMISAAVRLQRMVGSFTCTVSRFDSAAFVSQKTQQSLIPPPPLQYPSSSMENCLQSFDSIYAVYF